LLQVFFFQPVVQSGFLTPDCTRCGEACGPLLAGGPVRFFPFLVARSHVVGLLKGMSGFAFSPVFQGCFFAVAPSFCCFPAPIPRLSALDHLFSLFETPPPPQAYFFFLCRLSATQFSVDPALQPSPVRGDALSLFALFFFFS